MPNTIKIERLPIEITRQAGTICIAPANTVYFLVPVEVVRTLKEQHGIDLQKKRGLVVIKTDLVQERVSVPDASDDPFELKIVYTISRLMPNGQKKPFDRKP